MKLGDYLQEASIVPELSGSSKKQVLTELVAPLEKDNNGMDTDQAVRVLLEREELGTTGIGDGIAIPHGKLDAIDRISVVVGRSTKGIEYEALDFKPCHIFFLVMAPEQVAGMHLRLLAHISRLLKDEHFRQEFLKAEDAKALWQILKNA
jgi:PTS system nitrogen regulatory IIA component